jgi:FixJ family two-component response regulator
MSRVFIVNRDPAVSEALADAVRTCGSDAEVFADATAFLHHPRTAGPSCLLLDMELPDMCGLALQALLVEHLEMPVIFTAKCPGLRDVVLAMKAGAVEFLSEPLDEGLLVRAIHAALDRSRAALARESETRALCARYASLSRRERQVMAAEVVAGRMNKLIAYDLGISLITVKAHRGRVMRKMRAASVAELVSMAARLAPASPVGEADTAGFELPRYPTIPHPSPAFIRSAAQPATPANNAS